MCNEVFVDADSENYDCDNLPSLPRPFTTIDGIPGSEDFVFDKYGNLWSIAPNDPILYKTTYEGKSTMVTTIPDFHAQGNRILLDGDLVMTDVLSAELTRVSPENGSQQVLAFGLPDGPNGIAVHKNGFVYVTHSAEKVTCVNPENGEFTIIDDTGNGSNGIVFSPDYKTLYLNNSGNVISSMKLNDEGEPLKKASPYATIKDETYLDGMTADVCGNLYVVGAGGKLWRVSLNKEVELVCEPNPDGGQMSTAANFGSGVGGWKRDKIYLQTYLPGIYEIDIGVPGKPEPHL